MLHADSRLRCDVMIGTRAVVGTGADVMYYAAVNDDAVVGAHVTVPPFTFVP